MKADLLTSKFYFPPPRPDLVLRPQLLERLAAGLSGKLTLVSAPAGFGKTTVVSEWLRDCGYPAAWLSLDKNDNDPSRFLIYLTAALQRINPAIGVDVQAVLEDSRSPKVENLLTRLVKDMERLPDKTIIVLDDYHLIEAKPVHDAVNFLIEYLPPTIHLVISGRTDPPLPVSKLRVQGDVHEVRTSQLRFTKQEVAAFLNDRMSFDLSAEEIAALEARTEGWVASLKLAAISMKGRDDWTGFIAKFSGSNRYVIDYLVDEVMASQPEDVQAFLCCTSILERFCAPLCEFVVGGSMDREIIEYLDRSNLFLIPLDDHKQWYRYHHLFADFLSQRLRVSEPGRIPELHRRASQWYEGEGLVDEAFQHALAARDLEGAARLVDGIAADIMARGAAYKFVKYVEQLPSDVCQAYPMLCVWHAWALLFMGQLERVEPALDLVEANPERATGIPNPGYVTTVRAYLAGQQGDLHLSIKLIEQALEEMSNAAPAATALPDRIKLMFRGAAVIWLGVSHRHLGYLDKANQLFVESAELNQKAGFYHAALASYEQLAGLAIIRGQLDRAWDSYRSGVALAQHWMGTGGNAGLTLGPGAGLQLGLGALLYQWNDLAGAALHIQRSADLLELGEQWERLHSYTMLAYLKQAQGDFQASAELLRKACAIEETIIVRRPLPTDRPRQTQLGILLSHERPEMAQLRKDASRRVETFGVNADDEVDFSSPTGYPREQMYLDLAILLIALDRAAEALPLLARLLEAAVAMERHGDEIRYRVLIALAQHVLGNTQAALDCLGQALTLAEPQGYVRLFVDEGQPMAELLGLAISHHISPGYASRLLDAFPKEILDAVQYDKQLAAGPHSLVEALSEREIDVLRLMAEGCKYQEIAERLVVSINTVRHHTRNVYSKLAANNRTQALARAKELNLL